MKSDVILNTAEFAESFLATGEFASPHAVHSLSGLVAFVGDDVVGIFDLLESLFVWNFLTHGELSCLLLRN